VKTEARIALFSTWLTELAESIEKACYTLAIKCRLNRPSFQELKSQPSSERVELWQALLDIIIAELPKPLGYVVGQFGKNGE
jgi:hypothetical protein